MSRATTLRFNLASGQNEFFVELAHALVAELKSLGTDAEVALDAYPEPRAGVVHVFLPPHEYVALTRFHPSEAILSRSIGISAEQPTSDFFAENLHLGHFFGAVFDINLRSVRAYRKSGIDAEHLQLGYTSGWDAFDRHPERDIDILFLGRHTERREQALASYADVFERFRCHIQLADGNRPGREGAADFVAGEAKRDLLSRAKVLVTLHGEHEPYFEWLRVVEAISAGCAIVTEHSTDIAPLIPGRHLLTGGPGRLGLLAALLVDDDALRERLRVDAFALLRDELPLVAAAARLASCAARIDAIRPVTPRTTDRLDFVNAKRIEPMRFDYQPALSPHSTHEGRILRTLKSQTIELMALRRRLARIETGMASSVGRPVAITHESSGWIRLPPRTVTVIVPLYNHGDLVCCALDSVERSHNRDWEIVVVDDASTDGGREIVRDWMIARDDRACRLLEHPLNLGLPYARNHAASFASTDLLLMLDADNELRRHGIDRLSAALAADGDAAFAYGIIERFDASGPRGLISGLPWQPDRLRAGNYIDALSLIRRSVLLDELGGYTYDSRLHGWEDYDLWVRMAEHGHHAAFVPEIIARYRVGASSMISTSNISYTDSYAALSDHAPRLMAGITIPH